MEHSAKVDLEVQMNEVEAMMVALCASMLPCIALDR